MNVVAVVQARMGSSRLPGKSLLALGGRPMLRHVLDRVRATPGVSGFVLATSRAEADRVLEKLALDAGWASHVGSEWDVLGRVRDAAADLQADAVLRVTADCPFWDPEVGAAVVRHFLRSTGHADYVSNDTLCSGYPDGLDAEVFTRSALDMASERATEHADREHVTRWMRAHLRSETVPCPAGDFSARKLSIDRIQDYIYARRVWQKLPAGDYRMQSTLEACALVDAEESR